MAPPPGETCPFISSPRRPTASAATEIDRVDTRHRAWIRGPPHVSTIKQMEDDSGRQICIVNGPSAAVLRPRFAKRTWGFRPAENGGLALLYQPRQPRSRHPTS